VLGIAEEALQAGKPLVRPAVAWRQVPVSGIRHETLVLAHGIGRLTGRAVSEEIGAAREVVVLVATIGGQLEEEVERRFPDDPCVAVAIDALGSAALHQIAVIMRGTIEARARRRSWQVTAPVAPGSAGWPLVSGQRQVFGVVDASLIGVALNESSMMLPRKSMSFVVGLGADVSYETTPCARCDLADRCQYRNLFEAVRNGAVEN
jgi:hypothetical protein